MNQSFKSTKDLTVKQVKDRLNTSDQQVRDHIMAGNLKAYDIGLGSRHEWRIKPEWVEEFEATRMAQPKVEPVKEDKLQKQKPKSRYVPKHLKIN